MAHDLGKLVDDLGAVRAAIRLLRAQEKALRDAILAARPNGAVTGQSFRLDLRQSESRRFRHRNLPDEILADPLYRTTVRAEVVKTEPLVRHTIPVADDFEVIEHDLHRP